MSYLAKSIRKISTKISPQFNTELCYFIKFKRKINLKNPKTFNEKILWLKLKKYNNDSLIKKCADKYSVREYIKECNCNELLTHIYGVYDSYKDINWDEMPKQFVIKFNIGSGSNIICKNKKDLDILKTNKTIKKWFREKYYLEYSEFQYKDVKPKILIEEFVSDENGYCPNDYKFYCFNGSVDYVLVCYDRFSKTGTKFAFYDKNWEWLQYDKVCLKDPHIKKPNLMDEAFTYAKKLSKDFKFVRVDLFITKDKIYFGELTFTPCGGLDNTMIEEAELLLGNKIKL